MGAVCIDTTLFDRGHLRGGDMLGRTMACANVNGSVEGKSQMKVCAVTAVMCCYKSIIFK